MTDHPLTETAAEVTDEMVEAAVRVWLGTAVGTAKSGMRAALSAALAVAPTDDRPWEPLNGGPVRVGDEVRREHRGMTTTAVVGRVDRSGELWTAEGAYLGLLRHGTWYVRRTPAPALDPLADLTPGTTIRDVGIRWWVEVGDAFISIDADGPCVATASGLYSLHLLAAFTTENGRTRYTREGDTWTAVTLNGETNE